MTQKSLKEIQSQIEILHEVTEAKIERMASTIYEDDGIFSFGQDAIDLANLLIKKHHIERERDAMVSA